MRALLGLSTFLASLVALVVAVEIHHKSSFGKPHAQPRVVQVRELESPTNRSLTDEVAGLGGRSLERRFDGVRLTLYDAGKGACGQTNTNSDFIVALNAVQFGSGGYCFQMITITVNGKTATAQITDECMGCPYGGLDLSRGLFSYFASELAGVLTGSWYLGTTPTTTTTVIPTTSYTPTSTMTTTIPTTNSSSSSSVFSSFSSTSSAANALQSNSPNATTSLSNDGLEQLNLAFVNIGAILLAAGQKLN